MTTGPLAGLSPGSLTWVRVDGVDVRRSDDPYSSATVALHAHADTDGNPSNHSHHKHYAKNNSSYGCASARGMETYSQVQTNKVYKVKLFSQEQPLCDKKCILITENTSNFDPSRHVNWKKKWKTSEMKTRNSFKVTFAIVPDHSVDLPYIKSSHSRVIWIYLLLNIMKNNSFPFPVPHKIFFFFSERHWYDFLLKISLSYPQQYISEASMCTMYFHRILPLFYSRSRSPSAVLVRPQIKDSIFFSRMSGIKQSNTHPSTHLLLQPAHVFEA